MTFIGFLLVLAVGIGIMYFMAGARRGDEKQGRNRQRRMGSAAYNTEFGQMDDVSQDLYTPVKPAASSAAVFQRENYTASTQQAGKTNADLSAQANPTSVDSAENTALADVTSATAANQAGNAAANTTAGVKDDTGNVEVENSARDSFTTNTVFNNTTNADAALNNAVINPTPGITDQIPVNPATKGVGATSGNEPNTDKQ